MHSIIGRYGEGEGLRALVALSEVGNMACKTVKSVAYPYVGRVQVRLFFSSGSNRYAMEHDKLVYGRKQKSDICLSCDQPAFFLHYKVMTLLFPCVLGKSSG